MASILSSGEIKDGNVIMILCGELFLGFKKMVEFNSIFSTLA
jgi:hypothetical protein